MKLNNLLIIEGNFIIGKSIVAAVNKVRFIENIRFTEHLQEAISFLEDVTYEVIILDLKLPDGNGLELLKILKEKQIETKVFVFSVRTELKRICLKQGAFAFFDKAKDFDELIEIIKNL